MIQHLLSRPVTRRQFTLGTLACAALALPPARPILAQGTPASASTFAGLGLPELRISATATGFAGVPDAVAAGRYLFLFTSTEDLGPEGANFDFVQPVGASFEEFIDLLNGSTSDGVSPDAFYDAVWAGGGYAAGGETMAAVFDLTPGEWALWNHDPGSGQQPAIFSVTGEMPTNLPALVASATITMSEFQFRITEGELTSGSHILAIENAGAQPHFVVALKGPDGMTRDDIGALLESEMTGTPVDLGFDPERDIQEVFNSGILSTNRAQWISLDLAVGTYAFTCFVPDEGDGQTHAAHGMYDVFQVNA